MAGADDVTTLCFSQNCRKAAVKFGMTCIGSSSHRIHAVSVSSPHAYEIAPCLGALTSADGEAIIQNIIFVAQFEGKQTAEIESNIHLSLNTMFNYLPSMTR